LTVSGVAWIGLPAAKVGSFSVDLRQHFGVEVERLWLVELSNAAAIAAVGVTPAEIVMNLGQIDPLGKLRDRRIGVDVIVVVRADEVLVERQRFAPASLVLELGAARDDVVHGGRQRWRRLRRRSLRRFNSRRYRLVGRHADRRLPNLNRTLRQRDVRSEREANRRQSQSGGTKPDPGSHHSQITCGGRAPSGHKLAIAWACIRSVGIASNCDAHALARHFNGVGGRPMRRAEHRNFLPKQLRNRT
jgi:hypothetical protein